MILSMNKLCIIIIDEDDDDSLEIIKIIDSSFEGMAQRKLLDGIKYS